ncbi:MAG TPA: hypothetical protein VHS78_00255 [Candidatus Elarobacter sp.]|nr:hypothetical protein [Candidatus Elarobacter sp.]
MGAPLCLRCKTVALVPLDSPEQIAFFECPVCRRQFARAAGKALCFRWMHPISLALYPVIFAPDPVAQCERVAATLAEQSSPERRSLIVREITLELEDPTQQVRDIVGCHASEEDLRAYLRCVAERLRELVP